MQWDEEQGASMVEAKGWNGPMTRESSVIGGAKEVVWWVDVFP